MAYAALDIAVVCPATIPADELSQESGEGAAGPGLSISEQHRSGRPVRARCGGYDIAFGAHIHIRGLYSRGRRSIWPTLLLLASRKATVGVATG